MLLILPAVLQVRRVVDGKLHEFPSAYLGAGAIAQLVKGQAAATAQGAAQGDDPTVSFEAYVVDDEVLLAAQAKPASRAEKKKKKKQVPAAPVVLLDVETTGFGNKAEIIQLAVKCKGTTFSVYIVPAGSIHPQASKVRCILIHSRRLLKTRFKILFLYFWPLFSDTNYFFPHFFYLFNALDYFIFIKKK